ncbi:MAG: MarR family transcriptional regulator [Roseicyclus sp.]
MSDTRSWDLRLGYLIHDVSRLRRVSFDRELAPLGITRSQWWVLAFISRNDGLPQTRLAKDLDVGKVALGSLIDRLQSAGFVERRNDDHDRRVKRIFLTDKARTLIDEIRPVTESFNDRLREGISQKDLEITSRTLYRMKHNLIDLGAADEIDQGRAAE